MKKIILVLAMLFIIGCGGGGSTPIIPPVNDLSGLEGTWAGSISITGNIDFPAYGNFNAESIPVANTFPFEWEFTKNTVTGSHGNDFVWTYNGAILTLQYAITEQLDESESGECGLTFVHDIFSITIPIIRTATSGIITGSLTETWITESCGNGSGVLEVNGNIHR